MSAEGNYVDATCYAQVEPNWRYTDGLVKSLHGASVVRLTQRYPNSPIGGTVVVKLTLRIPTSAFDPLRPAPVVVPVEAAQPVMLEVAQ